MDGHMLAYKGRKGSAPNSLDLYGEGVPAEQGATMQGNAKPDPTRDPGEPA